MAQHQSKSSISKIYMKQNKKIEYPFFPIVGVGASAGGLEAFSLLLKGLPPKPSLKEVEKGKVKQVNSVHGTNDISLLLEVINPGEGIEIHPPYRKVQLPDPNWSLTR